MICAVMESKCERCRLHQSVLHIIIMADQILMNINVFNDATR